MSAALDISGRRFVRLVVVKRTDNVRGRTMWQCVCDCGVQTIVRGSALTSNNSRSCGCLVRDSMREIGEMNGTHRMSRTAEYGSWSNMMRRCYDKKNNRYRLYGALGVIVCDQWRDSFEVFLQDIGFKPSPAHSLDRYPDNAGNYEPGNCRWATLSQQNKNRKPFNRKRTI